MLVDVRDRADEHSTTYVNEENIVLLKNVADAMDYRHPRRQRHFDRFHSRMNTWSPNKRLRKRYPLD